MATRKASKKAAKKSARKVTRKPTQKQLLTAEGVKQGKSLHRAALDAGYAPSTAKSLPYNSQENTRILELIQQRRAELIKRAQIHTDEIVGSLAEIATASMADVVPEDEFLQRARALGTDHLIKKLKVKTRYIPNGRDKDPDREVTHEFEMYSRLDALNQLRDTFGMKEEPRTNTLSERQKQETEAALVRIMERDRVDRAAAANTLIGELRAIPNTQGLIEVVNQLIH
jgi:phage terminase small subunit